MSAETSYSLPEVVQTVGIPRILHQTFATEQMPDALRCNVDRLQADNPGWEHRFYDDAAAERIISEEFGGRVLDLYLRINSAYGAARADLFRYLVMYRHGGIYLDVKSRFTHPIGEVIRPDDSFILSQWRNGPGEPHEGWGLHADLADLPGGELQQWHIMAAPGHPFLRAVIERVLHGIDHYSPWRTGVGWIGVLRLTGPIAYTRSIRPLMSRYPCRVVESERDLSLEYSIFERSEHQRLAKTHYTQNTTAVVRRPGLPGLADRGYIAARELKHRLLPQR